MLVAEGGASLARPLASFTQPLNGLLQALVHLLDHELLLLHAVVRLRDALVQLVVLIQSEVRCLAVLLKQLLLGLLLLSCGLVLVESEQGLLLLLSVDHLSDERVNILWLGVSLHLRPHLHDRVLYLHLERVLVQVDGVLLRILRVVVEDVVESHLVQRREQCFLDVLPRLLQVGPAHHDGPHAIVGEREAANRRSTNIICVCQVLHDEGLVVQNGTGRQSLDHKLLVRPALVIRDRELHDTRLDDDHAVNDLVSLEDSLTLLVGLTVHVVHQLLLGHHRQVSEVFNLVALHLQERPQVVLVLEDVVFECGHHAWELP